MSRLLASGDKITGVSVSVSVLSVNMYRFLCPLNSLDKSTGMGSHSILQGLPDPGIKPGSLVLHADS